MLQLILLIKPLTLLCALQQAVEALSTPGVHCFLHLLPSLCLCAAFTDIGPLNGRVLQACSVQIIVFGIQVCRSRPKCNVINFEYASQRLRACTSL